jgi:hypothetical protein
MPTSPEASIILNCAQQNSQIKRILQKEWKNAQQWYLSRVAPWANDRTQRMAQHQKHPVYDFLFEYYSFRPAHLLRWTPGFNVWLEGATHVDIRWREFVAHEGGLLLPAAAYPRHRVTYLEWAVQFLEAVLNREPSFSCMGLHEWAMVYRQEQVRHATVPLRLPRAEIDAVVESQGLRCTHYDAYRFFTPAAAPRNRWPLTRATTTDHDQPGCIHANMDLYRLAYKIAPFCPADLLADTFELALAARTVDMRASPYDLRAYGFEPIPIETREGREQYVELQRSLATQAQPLRQRLLSVYEQLLREQTHREQKP